MARQLLILGFDAAALQGGYAAWRAEYPVEAKGRPLDLRARDGDGDGVEPRPAAPARERRAARDRE